MEQVDPLAHPVSGAQAPDTATPPAAIAVTLWEGGAPRAVEAWEGESLMIALKRAGLGLLAVCGGKGACGTCKVAFPADWLARLPPAEKRELRLLAHLKAGQPERLSCRITLEPALNGLQVLAADA